MFLARLAVVFAQSIEGIFKVENEDAVGAAPTGDAPTTSEWSTILFPTKLPLILEVWQYLCMYWYVGRTQCRRGLELPYIQDKSQTNTLLTVFKKYSLATLKYPNTFSTLWVIKSVFHRVYAHDECRNYNIMDWQRHQVPFICWVFF